MDSFKVGSNIDAWFTKCKLVLAHTIEAVAGSVIKRVHCNTCRGKHQFKGSEPGTKTSAIIVKSAKVAKAKPKAKANDFSRLMRGKNAALASPYSINKHFSRGDLINHSLFGMGVVVEQKDVQKIEVLFEGGAKILIHARA